MIATDAIFHFDQKFELESGGSLPGFQLKYTTLGQLNKQRDNVVWICHALTGSSDFTTWWANFFSEDCAFNRNEYFFICANTLGGCYGSTGPLSHRLGSATPYFHDFPLLTNRDVIRAFDLLRESLRIEKVHTLLGGSLGGQQVLEWAIHRPEVFQNIIPIATNARHSAWGIAFNEAQRMAIAADPTWQQDDDRAGRGGMKAARAMAMISFRTYNTYAQTQSELESNTLDNFRASSYQRYQGEKLANRFNAFTYWTLTKMMDNHNVGRHRGSVEEALGKISARTLVIGIDSDGLFPLSEQRFLATHITGAELRTLSSLHGHDGFLVEFKQFNTIIRNFISTEKANVLV